VISGPEENQTSGTAESGRIGEAESVLVVTDA
jgi:hypothetical protein